MTQKAQVEINKFVAGLITDASPLTFPENSSSVDINMILNSDGSRQRALGIDYEAAHSINGTNISNADSFDRAFNVYRWENVGGDPQKVIIVVQIGNQVHYFDADSVPLSSNRIATRSFTSASVNQEFSFTAVDGNLVIATGENIITTVQYDSGSLSYTTDTIKVRDFFGVDDVHQGDDLTVGSGVQIRPTVISDKHQYNLRNQGFGIPRMNNVETLVDPIRFFRDTHEDIKDVVRFPSNADNVVEYLYADANDQDDRTTRRYFAKDSVFNPIGSSRTAQGYYIIDLLRRGSSRKSEDNKNHDSYPELQYEIDDLPDDRTPGGATLIGEFAGRVWFGGFSGEVVDGDTKSPKLASYVAFSQLVNNPTQITRCYQEGDPTSDVEPDIIDTDGGYIRINNAYGVSSFVNLGRSFFVGAANGWWRIYGGNDSGFTATNYVLEKVTDKGVRGRGSVVQVENTLIYWADDGIYWIKQNEFGDWASENITQNRIQRLYNGLSIDNKQFVRGVYDSYQRKVRWLYNNRMNVSAQQKELVLDINLNAFYERHISQITSGAPVVLGGFNTNVYQLSSFVEDVVVGSDPVLVDGEDTVITSEARTSDNSLYEVGYVIATRITGTVQFTFGAYTDPEFIDWRSYDGVGVDAPATLVTGTASGGDNSRQKQIPYLFVHMKRTEDGFRLLAGDMVPTNQSSCTVQSQWDWTNSSNSNKWGIPFQAYRYRRPYYPADVSDPFDTGYELIVTKNKLRGRGRSIALKFTSSPAKEMHIYGWSLALTVNDNV